MGGKNDKHGKKGKRGNKEERLKEKDCERKSMYLVEIKRWKSKAGERDKRLRRRRRTMKLERKRKMCKESEWGGKGGLLV